MREAETMHFEILIQMPVAKVWETMLKEMFQELWPKALQKLKEVCER